MKMAILNRNSTKVKYNDKISQINNEEVKGVQYIDITNEMYKNAKPNEGTVKKQKDFEYEGEKYIVDGHNVVYKHDEREIEVAKLLNKTFGGNVRILPNINKVLKVQIIFLEENILI